MTVRGRWYAPKCVTPGVSAWSHRYSINISINIKNVQPYILKGRARGARTPQTILNFPQKDCLRMRKVSRLLHCLQSYWRSLPQFMFSHWNKLSIKSWTQYFLNKNATLTPNSCDCYDLRTFVAKFCRRIYALFPQNFGDWKGGIRRLSRF